MAKPEVMPEVNLMDSCRARKVAKEQIAKIETKIKVVENEIENYRIIQKHFTNLSQLSV
jgi:hypothetical protein